MKSRAFLFWVAMLLVFGGAMTIMYAAGLIGATARSHARETADTRAAEVEVHVTKRPANPTLEISEFQMTDQLGRKFHSDQLKGQIWVGSIFFSKCPSTCRMQNAEVSKLQTEYADKGVRFVSITCDPEHDTVATLAEYARMFNANPDQWYFLTGKYSEAERIGNTMFGITVQPETHSDRLVLINREGKVHSTHRSMLFDDVRKLREELDKLLAADPSNAPSEPAAGAAGI